VAASGISDILPRRGGEGKLTHDGDDGRVTARAGGMGGVENILHIAGEWGPVDT
jgi:hypothetical protein